MAKESISFSASGLSLGASAHAPHGAVARPEKLPGGTFYCFKRFGMII